MPDEKKGKGEEELRAKIVAGSMIPGNVRIHERPKSDVSGAALQAELEERLRAEAGAADEEDEKKKKKKP